MAALCGKGQVQGPACLTALGLGQSGVWEGVGQCKRAGRDVVGRGEEERDLREKVKGSEEKGFSGP